MSDPFLTLLAAILLVPLAVLTAECLAAILPPATRRGLTTTGPRPCCAILVPAHDEEAGLADTLGAIRSHLQPGDRLLVVADNCTDRTAAIARSAGAEVLERFDPTRRGKIYAVVAGVDALRAGPPEVVVVIDADCRPAAEAIDRLARTAAATARPVQGAYWLDPPAGATAVARLSAWAVRFKNVVRPRGLGRLGLPCLLNGSGIAFPWSILRNAPLANDALAEDFRLAVDLAVAGHPPLFESLGEVESVLPDDPAAARGQRRRWEHGHLGLLFTQVPRLLVEAVRQRRADLAALALELGVPPLSVLALLWVAAVITALIFAESWLPAGMLLAGGAAVALAGLLAWAKFGRAVLPPAALLGVPVYVIGKLPVYARFIFRPQKTWDRTPRSVRSQRSEVKDQQSARPSF
jgi:cellulose synthase/poly-beta-1,6-N-acetylglucosamine synthase-like glycosyltransferase